MKNKILKNVAFSILMGTTMGFSVYIETGYVILSFNFAVLAMVVWFNQEMSIISSTTSLSSTKLMVDSINAVNRQNILLLNRLISLEKRDG